jgi:hypothetical protein
MRMNTRRDFIKGSLASLVGSGIVFGGRHGPGALAAPSRPLIENVAAACRRLAPLGWRQMLLDITGGQLDILVVDLKRELAKPLSRIDRDYSGFGDFAFSGNKAIEPGQPDQSLLYHALAAPTVVSDRAGRELRGFPTLAEIETVENYVYAARNATLNSLRKETGFERFGIATFALHYRNGPMSVSGRHAQLCYSRTGIARLGTLEPLYDPRRRGFANLDEAHPFDFRVVPRRFAAYLAAQLAGQPEKFGPQDALSDDNGRKFWVPIHKLFSGPECLVGMDLQVGLTSGMRNDELASFHQFLKFQGLENNWTGYDLEQFPFVVKDEVIASLSERADFGSGVLVPRAGPLIEEARYRGERLTFPVDGVYSSAAANLQMSSLFILPGAEQSRNVGYLDDAAQDTQRPAPEYINIRHRVVDGQVVNLNGRPDLMEILRKGGYDALHYTDSSGDGWVVAHCPQLEDSGVAMSVPAFCMVGLPDFLPKLSQRDLMHWWNTEVPRPLRDALWAVPPLALSQTRIAANIELPIGFSPDDTTVTAIVSQLPTLASGTTERPAQIANGPLNPEKVGLPDGSPGLFDPGWDASLGTRLGADGRLRKFLVGHGLGSPFIEDAKLCAALGSYWPGVAPDATRVFQPDKMLSGISYPFPSIVPLTDEEIGIVPTANGKFMPWDGVHGPRRRQVGNRTVVAYQDAMHVDYIDLLGTMTASLTARIDPIEYKARILSMAAMYWSLGIRDTADGKRQDVNRLLRTKASWAVLSFRPVPGDDSGLAAASRATESRLHGPRLYRFEVFRWGEQSSDPANLKIVLVEILEEATAYTDGKLVMLRRGGEWTLDNSIPT